MTRMNIISGLFLIFFILIIGSVNCYVGQPCDNDSNCTHCEICLFVYPEWQPTKGSWQCSAACLKPGDDCGNNRQCTTGDNNTICQLRHIVPYLRQECVCLANLRYNPRFKKCVSDSYCESNTDCRPGATCSDNVCEGPSTMKNCTQLSDCPASQWCGIPYDRPETYCLPSKVSHGQFCDSDSQCVNQDMHSSCNVSDTNSADRKCDCRSSSFKYLSRKDKCEYNVYCDIDDDCKSGEECNDYHNCSPKQPMSSRTIGFIVGGALVGVFALIAGVFIVRAIRDQERTWERATNERTRIINS